MTQVNVPFIKGEHVVVGRGRDSVVVSDEYAKFAIDRSYELTSGPTGMSYPSVVAGSDLYSVDYPHGRLFYDGSAAATGTGRAVRLTGVGAIMPVSDGSVWVTTPRTAMVHAVRSGRVDPGAPIGLPNDRVVLTELRGSVVAVDTSQGFYTLLTASQRRSRRIPLPDEAASSGSVAAVGASSSTARHLLVLLADGTLLVIDPDSGSLVATVRTGVGDRKSGAPPPVESSGIVFLADAQNGRILRWDESGAAFLPAVQVTRSGAELELFEQDGYVWANHAAGPEAMVAHGRSVREVRKYGSRTARPGKSPAPGTVRSMPASPSSPPSATVTAGQGSPASHVPVPTQSSSPTTPTTSGPPGPGPSSTAPSAPSTLTPTASNTSGSELYLLSSVPFGGDPAFDPGAAVLFVGDAVLDIGDPTAPAKVATIDVPDMRGLFLSADGRTLMTSGNGTETNTYRVDVSAPADPHVVPYWHQLDSYPKALSSRGIYVGYSASPGGSSIGFWNVNSPTEPTPIDVNTINLGVGGGNSSIGGAAFSPDGGVLAVQTVSVDSHITLLDTSSGNTVSRLASITSRAESSGITFSDDGRTLLCPGSAGAIQAWDVSNPAAPRALGDLPLHDSVRSLDLSPDGTLLAAAFTDRPAELWDVSDLAHPRLLKRLGSDAQSVSFNATGTLLAVGGSSLKIWRTG
ncbi:WD40 repeat domain-containing protein [Streptomyces sp. NPDC059215]|uniref:WD40 repeat domain-containing protein n=1 Tax=unclassified Streptomyces TaxID=2593676 RepID=UPI0036CE890E